jgi:hypothetical protein
VRFRRRRQGEPPDTAAVLAEARARLEEDTERVIAPLRRMRERNNVTELAAWLLSQGGRHDGSSPARG